VAEINMTKPKPQIKSFQMSFDGGVLQRGFWIYVWRITNSSREWLYVGRTGDSSSKYASSPFSRIGQHLDFRTKAKGNAMARQLKQVGIDPLDSKFEMIAVGPIFDEQSDFDSHKPIRDIMSGIEKKVALILRDRNYTVIGKHQSKSVPDPKILGTVVDKLDKMFPKRHKAAT
jgi:hypothetical protein